MGHEVYSAHDCQTSCDRGTTRFLYFATFGTYASSQWETMLQCNVVSHWLGACKNDPWVTTRQSITNYWVCWMLYGWLSASNWITAVLHKAINIMSFHKNWQCQCQIWWKHFVYTTDFSRDVGDPSADLLPCAVGERYFGDRDAIIEFRLEFGALRWKYDNNGWFF